MADMDPDDLDAQIRAQVDEWSTNSTGAFTISLVRGDGSETASFQPEFTYPIFGEEEAIFGYQGLNIKLTFAAHNLRPRVNVHYDKKFKAMGNVRPTDIHEALSDFLPSSALSGDDVLRDEEAVNFVPPGDMIHEYTRQGHHYEIWCADLSHSRAKELLENIGILVPLFIEGGTMLQLEQDWTTQRWKLFLLYHLNPVYPAAPTSSRYELVGYGTSYRVFTFPERATQPAQNGLDVFLPSSQSIDEFLTPPESAIPNDFAPTAMPNNITSPLDLPSRERLSQFLILPPFQKSGHGQELYNTMYTHLTTPSNVREFTVEDPNEAFDDLRDFCDLVHLRAHNADFAALRIKTDIPPASLASADVIPTHLIVPLKTREKIMAQTKIMPRQFDRLVEMHTLSFIPPLHRSRSRITRKEKSSNEHDRAYYFWRLYVFNRDQLAQLEREERVEKLEAALDGVVEGYAVCLERVERFEESRGGDAVEGASGKGGRRKRKVVDEDEDEDEDGEEGEGEMKTVAVNGHKKPKV